MEYKRLYNVYERYDSYTKVLSWDTKHTYSQDDYIGIEWLLQRMIGVYDDKDLIALGSIREYNLINDRYAILSCIVKKNYRRQGIADKLLKELLEYCKELNIEKGVIYVLKNTLNEVNINKQNILHP